ncbi:hypothetical protein LguiB_001572 [Lonicera macranthoides]
MISSKWRDFKSTLSGKKLAIATGPYMTRHHLLLKPAEVKPNEWEEFVNGRLSHEFKLISGKHKAARAKQIHPHTTSRKGYARLTEEMKEEKKLKVVRRVDVWLQGHTRKNGNPVNEAVQETMTKIKEIPPTQDLISIRDDALAKFLGPERPGRVRGLGFGVTPTKVDAIVQSNGRVAALENQLKEFMEWRIQMEALLSQGNRANMDQFGGREDVAYNSAPTPQVGTGEVVANAKIESTDQQSLVHHQILGPDCYKVWVLETLVPNVMVYRYSDVFSTLDDAKGSTIAWPHRYIKFD